MNKLPTLVAASLLSITSIAAASPAIELHAGASVHVSLGTPPAPPPVIVRDHRIATTTTLWAPLRMWMRRPLPAPAPLPAWIDLGTVSTGKQALIPGDRKLDTLRLAVDGRVELEKVVIYFADRKQAQVLSFDSVLTERMPMPVIDLAGNDRQLKRIVVFTKAANQGSIKVLGRNDARRPKPAPVSGWTKLGAVSTGQQVLRLEGGHRYDAVALSVTGKVHLDKIMIRFANGDDQIIAFDEDLTTGSASPMIDLAGADRRIKSIVVFSDDQLRGELTLFAI